MDVEFDSQREAAQEKDDSYRRELLLLFKTLRSQALCNIEYFKSSTDENGKKFNEIFNLLYEHLDMGIEPYVSDMLKTVHRYDFSASVQANGYRSFIRVIHKCCLHILQLTRHISVNKESFLFRAAHYAAEIGCYVSVLGQLRACFYYLKKLMRYCKDGELFGDEQMMSDPLFDLLLKEVESLNQECFYGRSLGFQFTPSMQKPLSAIVIALASFSEGYGIESTMYRLYSSMLTSGKYYLDPEQRAERVVTVTRNADINFCKAFWDLNETSIMHQMPLLICPSVQVDKVFHIPPNRFTVPSVRDGEEVMISPPSAHTGVAPVNVRLLSTHFREGMEEVGVSSPRSGSKVKSNCLVIQCHGGGFVAQSSASHQVYLRHWVKDLDTPMLCIDYSLAPDAPFPRGFQECFFAYAWAIQNCEKLGSTGERICLVGDSAGANLMISVAMKAAEMGIRSPDGIVCAYATVLIRYTPSPSRILTLMDPLLPIGVLSRCLAAYAGICHPCPAEFYSPSRAALATAQHSNRPISKQDSASPDVSPPMTNSSGNHGDRVRSDEGDRENCVMEDMMNEPVVFQLDNELSEDVLTDITNSMEVNDNNRNTEKENENNREDDVPIIEVTVSDNSNKDSDDNRSTLINRKNGSKRGKSNNRDLSLNLNIDGAPGTLSNRTQRLTLHKRSPSMPIFTNNRTHRAQYPMAGSPVSPSAETSEEQFGSPPTFAMVRHFAQSPLRDMRHVPISDDPYMSPYLAPDSLLRGLPPVHLVGTHLDPCLDDSVMFARRLHSLGKEVHFEPLEDLPHGFLNFVLISQDAKQGSDRVVRRIADVLKLNAVDDETWVELFPSGEEK